MSETTKKIYMPSGLLGFDSFKNYELVESEYKPFLWLQNEEDKSLSFLVVDPFIFFKDYELDVDNNVMNEIDITSPSDVIVLTIITIPRNGSELTVNLQGPIVINKNNNKAMQVILADPKFTTKHVLSRETVKGGI